MISPRGPPLQFTGELDSRSDEATSITADFRSVKQEHTGRYVLQLVADEVTVNCGTETEACCDTVGANLFGR